MVPGQGLGADARAQNLACSWSGRGLVPPGVFSSARACLLLPPAQLLPGAPPHTPSPLPGFLLGRAWCPPGPQDVWPGPWIPARGLFGPCLFGPCQFGRAAESPEPRFPKVGGPLAARLALGWHFLLPPPPSLAEAGRELVGVPRLPSGGPGAGREAGGPWRAFWRREPMQLGAVGGGNAPCPPEGAQGLLLGHAQACIQPPRGTHHLKKRAVPVPWEQSLTLLSVTFHPYPGAL